MNEQESKVLAILTLKRHKDGVWIRRLVESLQIVINSAAVKIDVVVLEDYMHGPLLVSKTSPCPWIGLVNRISDAAEPWEVKICMALFQVSKHVWRIPIWNGPEAYSLCTHKWCHHVLFTRAGLKSPDTVASLQPSQRSAASDLEGRSMELLRDWRDQSGSRVEDTAFDYLIKPNAGGFGAGIQRRTTPAFQEGESQSHIPSYSDEMILFQTYMTPLAGKIYRIWFLNGKVQCAVERTINAPDSRLQMTNELNEFTSGCVAGVCSLPKQKHGKAKITAPAIVPWSLLDDVRKEIELQLLPVLPDDCHCGSVEFLHGEGGQRYYFDLNLLSTLPVDESTSETDPWIELATAIWGHMI